MKTLSQNMLQLPIYLIFICYICHGGWRIVKKGQGMELKLFKSVISGVTLAAFLCSSVMPVHAQSVLALPEPGARVALSQPLNPPVLKGIKVYPQNPFRFDFILSKGDVGATQDQLKDESVRLIKYFLASMTVPEKDLWVNLSPYEKDRIVPDAFGLTEMGRDLLAQDYLLKQITASIIYPEDEIGKKFWKKVYEKAYEKYGMTDVPLDTFNKVWVMPDKATVYENAEAGTAYIVASHLRVMLESDYLALEKNADQGGQRNAEAKSNETQELAKNVIREVILPELEKEVNEGKNFTQLRQVYQSLILATWFKKKITGSILSKVYVDQKKVAGVNVDNPEISKEIWGQYVQAFKKGVYNYIKEEEDPLTQEVIPRKYFSGGVEMTWEADHAMTVVSDRAAVVDEKSDNAEVVAVQLTSPGSEHAVLEQPVVMGVAQRKNPAVQGDIFKNRSKFEAHVASELEKTQAKHGLVRQDHPVYQEINRIFQDVLSAAGVGNQGIRLNIINSEDVDAYWMVDSGEFFLSLGLIKQLKSWLEENGKTLTQDMIAAVLSHEVRHLVQHIEGRDVVPQEKSKNWRMMSQNKEYDADTGGLYITAFAGFNPNAMVDVLKFLDALGDVPFISSHPKSDNRIGEVQKILQSPDHFIPNVDKPSLDFSRAFLGDDLVKTEAKSAAFHREMLSATSLDDLVAKMATIDDPVLFEEFLMHYYLRMLFGFSSGVVKSPGFQRYIRFILTASNINRFVKEMTGGSGGAAVDFSHTWGMPTEIGKMFQYYYQQVGLADEGRISALGRDPGMPRAEVINKMLEEIDTELDRLEKTGFSGGSRDVKLIMTTLRIIKKSMVEVLNSSEGERMRGIDHVGSEYNLYESKIFTSLDEAKKIVGEEWIVESSDRNNGSVHVTYIDQDKLTDNFELFWEFMQRHDKSVNERVGNQAAKARQSNLVGVRDWMKKRYGEMKMPDLLFDIESNLNGFVGDHQPVEVGRTEFLPAYLQSTAFEYLISKVGAFGESTGEAFPVNETHFEAMRQKILDLMGRRLANSGLSSQVVRAAALIQYMSLFRGFRPETDTEVEQALQSLTLDDLTRLMDVMEKEPPFYLTNMPQNIQGMIDFNGQIDSIQNGFVSYYFLSMKKLLERKKATEEIGLSDLEALIKLKKKLEIRLGKGFGQSKGFVEAIGFVLTEILRDKTGAILEAVIKRIEDLGDTDVKSVFLDHIFKNYFGPQDFNRKAEVLERLMPKKGAERNKQVEALVKSVNYDGMGDSEKKDFLRVILPLFETIKNNVLVEGDSRAVQQALAYDYMKLLKSEGMHFVEMVTELERANAVVRLFDLIVENQEAWTQASFEDLRRIIGVIKASKNGYEHFQFAIGSIGLSKLRSDTEPFLMTDDTSSAFNKVVGRGIELVYVYKEAMLDKRNFSRRLLQLITGTGNLFEGRSVEDALSLTLEFLPQSAKRDELLAALIAKSSLSAEQIEALLPEFMPLEDNGGFQGMSAAFSRIDERMVLAFLDLQKLEGGQIQPDEINVASIIRSLKDAMSGVARSRVEDQQALIVLENQLNADLNSLRVELSSGGQYPWGIMNEIRSRIFGFVVNHIVPNNPHFDFFNIRDFKYQYTVKFKLLWSVYKSVSQRLQDRTVSIEEKIRLILHYLPETTNFRDNELEKAIAVEEANLTGREPSLLNQIVQFVGLGYDPYAVVVDRSVDMDSLDAQKAQRLIALYRQMIPLMTKGTSRIVLGRKIFELQKRFSPEVFQDFDRGLREILDAFPQFSPARDSVLSEFINMGAVTHQEQLRVVDRLVLEQQRLSQENEIVRDQQRDEIWNTFNKFPSREEKRDFLLWILNPSRPMPKSLAKFSSEKHVNLDSLPALVFSMTKGERDKFFYDALRGYNGLFDTRDDPQNMAVLDTFVTGLFSDIFPAGELGSAENMMQDIFRTIFLKYSPERRILLFNALIDVFKGDGALQAGRAKKVRALLEQMGIIGVKVGQYLSERPQLFVGAEDILQELRDLKKDATAFHKRALFQVVQEEGLSDEILEILEFLAAASGKQVNEVKLSTGEHAAGKFLRPAVRKFLEEDLNVIGDLLGMLDQKYPDLGLPVNMRNDLESMVSEELQFDREVGNVRAYQAGLDQRGPQTGRFKFRVPKVIYNTENVIVEELVHGLTFDDLILVKKNEADLSDKEREKRLKIQKSLDERFTFEERNALLGMDIQAIKEAVLKEFFQQAFGEGFFHADLHYGNVMVTPSGDLFLIDWGAAGELADTEMQPLLNLLVAVNSSDARWAVSLLNEFVKNPVGSGSSAERRLLDVVHSSQPVDEKFKDIIKIVVDENLGDTGHLLRYLKGLSAVSPIIDSLSTDQLTQIVTSYLTAKSKIKIGARRVLGAVQHFVGFGRAKRSVNVEFGKGNESGSVRQGLLNGISGAVGMGQIPSLAGAAANSDFAMKGGIDFNPNKMNLELQNKGGAINFNFDPAMIQQLQNMPGFAPVVIDMHPIGSVQMFLGLNDGGDKMVAVR